MITFKNEREEKLYLLTAEHINKGHKILDVLNSVSAEDSQIISKLYDKFRKEAIYYLHQTKLKLEGERYEPDITVMSGYLTMILINSIPTKVVGKNTDN